MSEISVEKIRSELELICMQEGMDYALIETMMKDFEELCVSISDSRERASDITDPTEPGAAEAARMIRLELKKARCAVESTRQTMKGDIVKRGRAIDGFAKRLKDLCEPVEAEMLAIEEYEARQERERVRKLLLERAAAIEEAGGNPDDYNLSNQTEESFALVLDGVRRATAERKEAERVAEEERIAREKAEAEERENMRKENERLRREAEAHEAELKAEREKAAAAERALTEAGLLELKRIADEKAAAEKAAQSPDKEKLLSFAMYLDTMDIPNANTLRGQAITEVLVMKLGDVSTWLQYEAAKL